ncbi:MAG TPA: hypothetical protein VJK51_04255 [Candidatus Nanoarchaeia archaeon]|nr:hypothetical protein [Candidatus Nanoarchaeia archaeon]
MRKNYTSEGLPIITKEISQIVIEEFDQITGQTSKKDKFFELIDETKSYLSKNNPTLLTVTHMSIDYITKEDTPFVTAFSLGFFKNYHILRRGGENKRRKEPYFEGIPPISKKIAVDGLLEFGLSSEEMTNEIKISNMELYKHGEKRINNPPHIEVGMFSYLYGFLSMMQLLRRQEEALLGKTKEN